MFSGGLDRQILAWDINSPRPDSPLTKLAFPESQLQGGGGGIYALATNARGTLVAAGSPEKVVRIWDPRVGGSGDGVNSISKLVGHSDNIRAICLSDDGRYVSVVIRRCDGCCGEGLDADNICLIISFSPEARTAQSSKCLDRILLIIQF